MSKKGLNYKNELGGGTLNIVVCLKQILDPEVPSKDFKLDNATGRPVQGNAKLVMDSFGEYALEVAIQIKEKVPGSKITAICVGDKSGEDVLRRALALMADEAVRVWDAAWNDLDAPDVACILAQVIKQQGGADLVLVGRQAGDIERGLVGPFIAAKLGASSTTIVARVEAIDGKLKLRREAEDGFDIVESTMPAVVSITNDETNFPRLPKVKDLMMAARKPIKFLNVSNLEFDAAKLSSRIELKNLYIPVLDAKCEIIEGDDGPAKAVVLTERLRELKLLG